MTMTPEEKKLLADHIQANCWKQQRFAIAKILYKNTAPEKIQTFEGIETAVREKVLEYVSPQISFFLLEKRREQIKDASEQ